MRRTSSNGENTAVAYRKMKSGDVRFRMVLVTGNVDNTSEVVNRSRQESRLRGARLLFAMPWLDPFARQ